MGNSKICPPLVRTNNPLRVERATLPTIVTASAGAGASSRNCANDFGSGDFGSGDLCSDDFLSAGFSAMQHLLRCLGVTNSPAVAEILQRSEEHTSELQSPMY